MLKEAKFEQVYIVCGYTDMRRSIDGLAVVNVADGADVNMGLGSFKLLLCHLKYSSCIVCSIIITFSIPCGFPHIEYIILQTAGKHKRNF